MAESVKNPTKPKSNLKRVLAAISLILISAFIAGGATWYLMAQKAKTAKESADKQIEETREQNDDLKKQLTEQSSAQSQEAAKAVEKLKELDFLPLIVFKPATFTDKEKQEIRAKIVNPFLAYENEKGLNIITLAVKKYAESDRPAGYWYTVDTYSKNNGWGGWLIGKDGVVEYWKPDCMGECPISESFKKKYPNNVPD